MPHQSQIANVALELMPGTLLPAYRVVWVAVPRQSGKTTLILVIQVDRCLNFGALQNVMYTAQDRIHSRSKWEEQCDYLRTTPLVNRFNQRRQTGLERTIWKATGSTVAIEASSETSGHGPTLDLAIVDEGWAQKDERLAAAFRPAMMTRRNAQEYWFSTMGTDDSVPWNDRVDDGRARAQEQLTNPAARRGVAYFEWSAPEDADPYAEETWWSCMPALGRTVDVETVRADAHSLPEPDFRRGYLNQRTPGGKPIITPGQWPKLRDDEAHIGNTVALGVDITPDRTYGAVCAAGFAPDGTRVALELIDHKPGAGWVVGRLAELNERWAPVAICVDKASPAGKLADDMRTLGLPLVETDTGEYAGACGSFYDAIVDGTLSHLAQAPLDAAIGAARKRAIGDTWAWARRTGGDVSPLVAATLARFGLLAAPLGEPCIF
jgi:Phage Terminase